MGQQQQKLITFSGSHQGLFKAQNAFSVRFLDIFQREAKIKCAHSCIGECIRSVQMAAILMKLVGSATTKTKSVNGKCKRSVHNVKYTSADFEFYDCSKYGLMRSNYLQVFVVSAVSAGILSKTSEEHHLKFFVDGIVDIYWFCYKK